MKRKVKRATVQEILHIAMDLERRTMELYATFVAHHTDEDELRRFWLSMARHEAGHFGALALVEGMLKSDPKLEVRRKVWFEEATIVRLRSLLNAYSKEAKEPPSTERALEMAIDIEGSELEDVVVDLLQVVTDGPWRDQAVNMLIHDLGDLTHMVEKFTHDPHLLRRANQLLDRRIKALQRPQTPRRRSVGSVEPA